MTISTVLILFATWAFGLAATGAFKAAFDALEHPTAMCLPGFSILEPNAGPGCSIDIGI